MIVPSCSDFVFRAVKDLGTLSKDTYKGSKLVMGQEEMASSGARGGFGLIS